MIALDINMRAQERLTIMHTSKSFEVHVNYAVIYVYGCRTLNLIVSCDHKLCTPDVANYYGKILPCAKFASLKVLGHAILLRGPHAASKCAVFNAYGPRENTMCSTFYEVPAGTTTPPPIGKPVPNTKCYVLDPHMHLVPIGVYGELYLGGVQLARGYFGRPDLTAKSFVPNPFFKDGDSSSSRVLYKTGDIVRWREDGNLEHRGRAEDQAKQIDLEALPQPAIAADENYVGPRTHTERSLAAIWAKALRLDRVGVHSTFFELGGHSLLAVQMMSEIRAAFKIEVPLILLFEQPSIASLAECIELIQAQACASALF